MTAARNCSSNAKARYRWSIRPRMRLASSAEGTLANVGWVTHGAGCSSTRAAAAKGVGAPPSHGRSRRYRRATISGQYRPHQQRWVGPVVRNVLKGSAAPACIYCGGNCEIAHRLKSCVNIERCEEHWRCLSAACVSRGRVVVIRRYPLEDYERR